MAAGGTLSGSAMTVKTGGTPAVTDHVGRWKVTKLSESSKFATNSTAGWKKTQVGVKDWNGTLRVLLHDGAALAWTVSDTVVEVELHIKAGDADYYSGEIKITNVDDGDVDAESGEPLEVIVTFEGHGALTANGSILAV